MRQGYIAVLDSGVGGLSVLNELIKLLPNERFLYLGDNGNAPYGGKSLAELKAITEKNIDLLKSYDLKALVLGCNTLSANLYREISDYAGVPTFGVYPPIEYALMLGGEVLLLATERTAERFKGIDRLTTVGLRNLARDIENNIYNARAINVQKNLLQYSVGDFVNKSGHYKTIILGCTHYFLVKNEILDHFRPQNIISGDHFTAKRVYDFLQQSNSLGNYKRFSVLFLGDFSKFNQRFSVCGGQSGLNFLKNY
ncbi:MAG: hypothetical protein E7346_05175 [Clostridiales bacterium]|nr:hypothetical protein [Clostridiales bacterium]